MNKHEFLQKLEKELSGLPKSERDEHINFYSEMIDDRMEDGLLEEEAIAQIGTVDKVLSQILADKYYTDTMSKSKKEKKDGAFPVWAIVLLAVGSPLWISIAAAVIAVVVSLLVSIWSVVVSLWATFGAFAISGPACVIGGIVYAVFVNPMAGLVLVAAGLVLAGLAILIFFASHYATKGCAALTVLVFKAIINCFRRKEKRNA